MVWAGAAYSSSPRQRLAVLLITNFILLRETPLERGLPGPEVNPRNVYAHAGLAGTAERAGDRGNFAAAVHKLRFLDGVPAGSSEPHCCARHSTCGRRRILCSSSGCLPSVAASRSALFPLCGGISVLAGGFLSDKLGPNGRNLIVVTGMRGCTVCLVVLGRVPGHGSAWAPTVLVGLVRLHAAGTLFVPCRRHVARFWWRARQRNGSGNHRWLRLSWPAGCLAIR